MRVGLFYFIGLVLGSIPIAIGTRREAKKFDESHLFYFSFFNTLIQLSTILNPCHFLIVNYICAFFREINIKHPNYER